MAYTSIVVPDCGSGSVLQGRELYHVPDYLVGLGFRVHVRRSRMGEPFGCDLVESYYQAMLPARDCCLVLDSLRDWGAAIDEVVTRPLRVHPVLRRDFSSDEAQAIAIVATAQFGDDDHLVHALGDLASRPPTIATVAATQRFAEALRRAGQLLSRCNAICTMGAPCRVP